MSLKSIIHDALEKAKHFIEQLLGSSRHLLEVALEVVNAVKNFDDSNPEVVDFVTKLIPGTADDFVVAKVRGYLPYVVVKLRWASGEVEKTPDALMAEAAEFLKGLLPAERATMLQSLWQLLSNEFTDDGVAISDLQKIGQVFFEAETK